MDGGRASGMQRIGMDIIRTTEESLIPTYLPHFDGLRAVPFHCRYGVR